MGFKENKKIVLHELDSVLDNINGLDIEKFIDLIKDADKVFF